MRTAVTIIVMLLATGNADFQFSETISSSCSSSSMCLFGERCEEKTKAEENELLKRLIDGDDEKCSQGVVRRQPSSDG